MNRRLPMLIAVFFAVLCPLHAQNIHPLRSFEDLSEHSPSQWYKVEARSPHNRPESDRHYWQSNFDFTCTDTRTGEIVWTRNQREKGAESPYALFVSDAGWTVIRTSMDHVICISPQGVDRGAVNLLKDALSWEELKQYAYFTYSGINWDRKSLWYFCDVHGRNLFVVRPWWERRILIDVEAGGLAKASPAVENAIIAYEHDYVTVYNFAGVIVGEKPVFPEIGQFIDSLAIAQAQDSTGQAQRQAVAQSPSDSGDLNNLSMTIGSGALVLIVLGIYMLVRRRARR